MNEVKQPKRPLIYYYGLMLLLLMLFNFLFMPWLTKRQIHEVDYNTFVTMVEEGDVGAAEVQTQENLILFTSKDGTTIYQTGMMPDTELTQRLLDAGVSNPGRDHSTRNFPRALFPAHLGTADDPAHRLRTVHVQKDDG